MVKINSLTRDAVKFNLTQIFQYNRAVYFFHFITQPFYTITNLYKKNKNLPQNLLKNLKI